MRLNMSHKSHGYKALNVGKQGKILVLRFNSYTLYGPNATTNQLFSIFTVRNFKSEARKHRFDLVSKADYLQDISALVQLRMSKSHGC